jgi:flagellin-specific chaperone FliS
VREMEDLKVVVTVKNIDEVQETINKANALIKELGKCLWELNKLQVETTIEKENH